MIRIRPYKACDAQAITTWIKDEYAFRQWSADRYENYLGKISGETAAQRSP